METEAETCLEFGRKFALKLGSDHCLVHVKENRLVLFFLAEFKRFHHDVLHVLLLLLLVVLFQLVAEFQQINQLQVNQLRRVLFGHHALALGAFVVSNLIVEL